MLRRTRLSRTVASPRTRTSSTGKIGRRSDHPRQQRQRQRNNSTRKTTPSALHSRLASQRPEGTHAPRNASNSETRRSEGKARCARCARVPRATATRAKRRASALGSHVAGRSAISGAWVPTHASCSVVQLPQGASGKAMASAFKNGCHKGE